MRVWLRRENSVWLGWLAGWVFIGFMVSQLVLGFIVGMRQAELPVHILEPIQNLVAFVLFALFLRGVSGFAKQKSDMELTKAANTFLLLNVLQMVIFYPYSFTRYLEQDVLTILLMALVPAICVTGIAQMRLAESMSKYAAELGTLGPRVVWWNKVAGWMLASVILIPVGLLAGLVAEFFLWRLLAKKV